MSAPPAIRCVILTLFLPSTYVTFLYSIYPKRLSPPARNFNMSAFTVSPSKPYTHSEKRLITLNPYLEQLDRGSLEMRWEKRVNGVVMFSGVHGTNEREGDRQKDREIIDRQTDK